MTSMSGPRVHFCSVHTVGRIPMYIMIKFPPKFQKNMNTHLKLAHMLHKLYP